LPPSIEADMAAGAATQASTSASIAPRHSNPARPRGANGRSLDTGRE
jgi:hypothetical protein